MASPDNEAQRIGIARQSYESQWRSVATLGTAMAQPGRAARRQGQALTGSVERGAATAKQSYDLNCDGRVKRSKEWPRH